MNTNTAVIVRYVNKPKPAGLVLEFYAHRNRWTEEYPDANLYTLEAAMCKARELCEGNDDEINVIEAYGEIEERSHFPRE